MSVETPWPVYEVPNIKWTEKPQQQHEKRSHHVYTDQFGREWETTLDTTTKPKAAPCSTISAHGWRDPLDTPAKYLEYGKSSASDAKGTHFFRLWVNVAQWEQDLVQSHADWNARLIATAAGMSPKDGGAALLGEGGNDVSPHLLEVVGEKPQPVEFVQALIAGNKWARGQDPKVPLWARKLLPIPVVPAARLENIDELKALFPDADEEAVRERMAKARAAKDAKSSPLTP